MKLSGRAPTYSDDIDRQPRIELMLINELDDKFRSLTRRIADTGNKRADSGKVSFTAMGAGAAVAGVVAALLLYFAHH